MMMNPQEFSQAWQGAPLVKFALSTPSAQELSEDARKALSSVGLPQTAEPWLHFMEFVLTDERTAAALEELHFYPIGSLANGDFICIDRATDKIIISDHEDLFYTWTLNSSLHALYESILLFAEFIRQVNVENPNFASDFKIPDGMLAELEQKLKTCDPSAFDEKGFWYTEIEALDDSAF